MNQHKDAGWLPLARLADLSEGINAASIDHIELVVIKRGEEISVFAGRCLHQEAPMAQGILEETHIVCSKHLWKYRLDSGALEGEPGIALQKFETRLQGEGIEIQQEPFEALKSLYNSFDEEDDELYQP